MNVLDIAISIFIVLETANVMILYFAPDSRIGNGVAVFNPWFEAKKHTSSRLFVEYMKNWVAGTKLIFIVLLIAILFTGNEQIKTVAVVAMIFSIATYYFMLHPIIKKLDDINEITPVGYSKKLFIMITFFIVIFSAALIVNAF